MSSIKYRNAIPVKQNGGSKGSALTLKEMDDNFFAIDVTEGIAEINSAIVLDGSANLNSGINDFTIDNDLTVGNDLSIAGVAHFGTKNTAVSSGGSVTIDWSVGNKYFLDLTEDITAVTFTAPPGACNLILQIDQNPTGGWIVSGWPSAGATVLWPGGSAPVITAAANSRDVISFYYDGTNYFGVATQNFL